MDSRIHSETKGFGRSAIDAVEAIVDSRPFQRLHDVTFLGILSPRFSHLPDHPLSSKIEKGLEPVDDGSRADHSLAVAALVVKLCDAFALSKSTTKYAAAWALIHDMASWPLSHTGEVAFSSITGITHKLLRHKIVSGSPELPREYQLQGVIREIGIDPERLNALFEKEICLDNTGRESKELRLIHSLIHSAITPDTLEGIYRTGRAIGIQVPEPSEVLDSFEIREIDCFDDAIVRKNYSRPVLKFWRQKQKIYESYINTTGTIEFESRWSVAVREQFGRITLAESFELSEDHLVETVSRSGLPRFESITRYKAPQKYFLDCSLKHKRVLGGNYPIESLSKLLIRNQR